MKDEGRRKTFSCEREPGITALGMQLVVFESSPLARAHAAWDDPGPDAQGGQRSIWLEPNLGSFHHKISGCTITLKNGGL